MRMGNDRKDLPDLQRFAVFALDRLTEIKTSIMPVSADPVVE